jgi:uncharacterized membrane protein (DUF4010 family)
VIIVAGLAFINYILLKILGPRGMEITAFFGGLVNSRKVILELGLRLRELGAALLPSVHRGILLAVGAMLIRNGLIIVFLAPSAIPLSLIPLLLMLAANAVLWLRVAPIAPTGEATPSLHLESPFQLSAALKFGLVFMALNVIGALAQRNFGSASFYFVSILGGLLSSASSIASAATLIAHHDIPIETGVNGIILSSLTSIMTNLPLIRGLVSDGDIKRRLYLALCLIAGIGLIGMALNSVLSGQIAPSVH